MKMKYLKISKIEEIKNKRTLKLLMEMNVKYQQYVIYLIMRLGFQMARGG